MTKRLAAGLVVLMALCGAWTIGDPAVVDVLKLKDGSFLVGTIAAGGEPGTVTISLGGEGGPVVNVPRADVATTVARRGKPHDQGVQVPGGPTDLPLDPSPYYRDVVRLSSGSFIAGRIVAHDRSTLTMLIGPSRNLAVVVPFFQLSSIYSVPASATTRPVADGAPPPAPTEMREIIEAMRVDAVSRLAGPRAFVSPRPSAVEDRQERERAAVDRMEAKVAERDRVKREAHDAYFASVGDKLDALNQQIGVAQAKGLAAEARLGKLRDDEAVAMVFAAGTMENDHNLAVMRHNTTAAVISDAVTVDQIQKVRALYQPQISAAQREMDDLLVEYTHLCSQRQAILNAAPR